jgi:membrane-bound serine protease (ClpP class)
MGGPFSQKQPAKGTEQEDGGKTNTAGERKALEDTAAFIRGIAEIRGRNAQWAESAVTEAKSITATEALELKVIDLIATSRSELLSKIDGRKIESQEGEEITLQTEGAPQVEFLPNLRTRILSFISDPNVAFILLTIGMYGLIIEFYNPGTLVPGTIGILCLVTAMFALNILSVNVVGVILLLLGLAFMAAEAFIPSFGIMGIGGFAAFIFGATIMFDTQNMPGMALDWGVIWGMAALGAVVLGLVIWMAYKSIRKKVSTGTESMVGEYARVVEWNGDKGRVHIQGENWTAISREKYQLSEGDKVLVSAVDGLTLVVRIE